MASSLSLQVCHITSTSRLTSPTSAISLPGVATFGRIKLEILTCPIRARRNGLTLPLLPRQRILRLAILVGIPFEQTGLRIWTCHYSVIFLSASAEVFSSGPKHSTLRIRQHGEFRSTI